MSLRKTLLAAGIAALAILPAAASAADRSIELGGIDASETWTSETLTGVVYGSDVTDVAPIPHCSELWSCDATLIRTGAYGNLVVDIAGEGMQGQDTLKDVDLHVYVSNKNGSEGELIGESTSAAASESYAAEDLPAGYYLVVVDWYLGAGSVDGTATLTVPTTETDTPPEFVAAEGAAGPDTTPARDVTVGAAAPGPASWTSGPMLGVSDAQDFAGCAEVNCDYTLVQVSDVGSITVTTSNATPTMADADVHVFASDADGTEGDEVASATNFTPNETAVTEVDPGYYLVRVDSTGAGTYDGAVSWAAPAPEDEEPTE
jgi:hypothetical protein